jgi:hypothetical protein
MREEDISYKESLKIVWFLAWRSYVFMGFVSLVGGLMSVFLGVEMVAMGVLVVSILGGFFWALPWFVRSMMKKQFKTFEIGLNNTSN